MTTAQSPFLQPGHELAFGALFLFEALGGTPAGQQALALLGLAPKPPSVLPPHARSHRGHESLLGRFLPPLRRHLAAPLNGLVSPGGSRGSMRSLLLGIGAGVLFFFVVMLARRFRAAA